MVGENPTPYGILALWAVNGLSIVYWVVFFLFNRGRHTAQGIDPVVSPDGSQAEFTLPGFAFGDFNRAGNFPLVTFYIKHVQLKYS